MSPARPLRVKFILPALTEATSPFWRPIKYSLFPPLGLATLAAYLRPDDVAVIEDEHVQPLTLHDAPDLVVIQVYITNAYRAYRLADHYRQRGCFVALGGLHVTSLPEEARPHADAIFLGPGEQTFPQFLKDFRCGSPLRQYESTNGRTLERIPPVRRDLIERRYYLVPNSIVVTRGCPQHCDFCYKDAFFAGGKSFYTQRVDDALAEIDRLPGRHLYFLDDHLLGDRRFGRALFEGMRGMKRLFQGAATVDSILRDDLIERAADAGLRSLFVGFETLTPANLASSNKRQNLGRDYSAVTRRLHDLGIMINGSFVFGMDDDDTDVFRRTVDWAIEAGITTATFHIQTPYPGTRLFARMEEQGRITTRNWDLYDTRHVVYRPARLTPEALESGYHWAYTEFYRWGSIARASLAHESAKHRVKHFAYAAGWKKFERAWNLVIRLRQLRRMTKVLEAVLSKVTRHANGSTRPAAADHDVHAAARMVNCAPMASMSEHDTAGRVSRRGLLKTIGAAAGTAAFAPALLRAQAPGTQPGPPSTVTLPPRDFGPNGAPTTYFLDPDILVVDPAFGGLVQVNSSIKRLHTGTLWAEGPAWNAQGRYLLWSDIPNNVQLRWLEDDGRVTVFRNPSNNSNGNTYDFQGRQLSCEHLTRRVVRYENDGSVTIIASAFEGKRLNSPNDVVAHPDGSYWFTDPPYGGQLYEGQPDASGGPSNAAGRLNPRLGQPPEAGSLKRELPTGVYRVDAKGQVTRVVSEAQVPDPNGLAFSPDFKRLYVASTGKGPGDTGAGGKGDMHVFEVNADNTLSNGRLFSDFMIDGVKCAPDGVRCDVDGNVWCSSNAGRAVGYNGVTVWTPQGKLIGRIRLPEVCGNVCFGGPKRNRLFMAASQSLYAVYVNTQGAGPG